MSEVTQVATTDLAVDLLTIERFHQLVDVRIDLSKRVTLIAGVNGSGKTKTLRILASAIGWTVPPFAKVEDWATPSIVGRWAPRPEWVLPWHYTTPTMVPVQPNRGVYFPASRPGYTIVDVDQLPVSWTGESALFEEFKTGEQTELNRSQHAVVTAPNLRLKQGIIVSALFGFAQGPGVEPNDAARRVFETYNHVLGRVLPKDLGFKTLVVRSPDVFIATETGEFPLDGASGGTGAMLDLVWQLTLAMNADLDAPFLVVIDELENHLHPAMQRTVLPQLLLAFPNASFVVATHSPHVFASVEDATHVVLRPVDGGFTATTIDMPASLLTPDEVLRDALGLEVTMPVWVEEKLDDVIARHKNLLEGNGYEALRDELQELGLSRLLPTATARILGEPS
jgi:energy-coupling factor transporter ATP-binding protein EcfA2